MSVSRGPLRIVLVRSGAYDYAELELHRPLHLVAANNVGKTSLISALQFLYIDDSRQMHFSHDWAQTRQHYFPDCGSLILFECMTPTGLQVFGLRGLGPVQGFEFERFAYSGAFRRDDYLEDRRPLEWEEVRRRLVDRDLRQLEPRHLRASLTGSGDARGAPLGLVPLKRSGSYESFRFLFRNLLRLSKIEQNQLKNLFIDICRPRLRKTEIDLQHEYADLFGRVDRQSQDVAALRQVAPAISDLIREFGERQDTRRRLAAMWRTIESALRAERERVDAAVAALEREGKEIEAREGRLKAEQNSAVDESNRLSRDIGALGEKRRELEALHERAKSFVPEMEAAIRSQLQNRYDELVARLENATRADATDLERRLRETRRRVDADAKLVERFAEAVVTWLRSQSGLNDRDLGDLFSVLDPALLGEVLGDGRIEIVDAPAAVELVRAIHGHADKDGIAVSGVRVRPRAAGTPSPLDDYQDLDVVRERIDRGRAEERRLAQLQVDARERDALVRDRDLVRQEVEQAADRLRVWELWERRKDELATLTQELDTLQAQSTQNTAYHRSLQSGLAEAAVAASDNKNQIAELQSSFRKLVIEVQRLSAPTAAWLPQEAGTREELGLEELTRTYRSEWDKQRRLSERVDALFAEVKQRTTERFIGVDEDETIRLLGDELNALEDREKAVRDLWTSLVDGMRNAFKSLVDGVDDIRKEVSQLTAALGRHQVSNLERIELEIVPQRDLIRRLKSVIEADEEPLFSGPSGRTRAARDIQNWLEDRPRLELAELFDLRFKVVDARGQTKSFDSLAQIESQGTSITIKVLVHLELLRMMLSDDTVTVPFFLDEVASLDGPNLRSLIEHASGMGFVPVVASPEARDCVDTLYFLRPGRTGLVLDETSRVRLHLEHDDDN